jgi:hypothetical protein
MRWRRETHLHRHPREPSRQRLRASPSIEKELRSDTHGKRRRFQRFYHNNTKVAEWKQISRTKKFFS